MFKPPWSVVSSELRASF